MFCFVFLKFIMSKLLPYVSDALFDMLDFSDFPQLLIFFFFFSSLNKMKKHSYHLGFLSLVLLRLRSRFKNTVGSDTTQRWKRVMMTKQRN